MSQEDDCRDSSSEENSTGTFSIPIPPHQKWKSAANDLERQLLAFLEKRDGSALVNDMARGVGFKSKKEINPTMYGMEKRGWVRKVQRTPPKWLILPPGRGALSGKATIGRQTGQDQPGHKRGRGGGRASQKRGQGRAVPLRGFYRLPSNHVVGRSTGYQVRPYSSFGGSSGFSHGSKWEPDEPVAHSNDQIRQGNSSTNNQRNVLFAPPRDGVQQISDRSEETSSETAEEPMDITPSVTSDSNIRVNSDEPWTFHGFGRGITFPEKGDPRPLPKPGVKNPSHKPTNSLQNTSDRASFEENAEVTSQLPTFPRQLLGNSNPRTPHFAQSQVRMNPGMGRGMGRLIEATNRLACSFDETVSPVNTGHSLSLENLEEKILSELSCGRPLSPVDLAKTVLGEGASSRDINPTLYKMEKVGLTRKVQENPPLWCASNHTGESQFMQEGKEQSISSKPVQHSVPPAPHLLLNAGNQGGTVLREPIDNSSGPRPIPPPSLSSNSVNTSASANISEMMKIMNKNPISAFMEFGQSVQQQPALEMVNQSGPSHKPKFTFIARVGPRKFPPVVTQNKKEGRREAAEAALRILAAEGAFQMSPTVSKSNEPGFGGSTFFDHIATLAHQTFNNLAVDIPECFSGKKVIAALVMKVDTNDSGRVIALGTGNRCVTGDKLSLEGQAVHDSHAEVITRRAFMRYMYRQLKIHRSNPEKTILSPSPSGKLRVREGCTFHLYISTAPCGDGAQFSWTDNQGNEEGPTEELNFSGHAQHSPTQEKNIQGLLRTKMELGEGTIPIQEKNPIQTWDAILQNQQRLRTMSCSDKVCRWNILGLQGSLLSNFIEPVYLSSLTLGALYHHGHLARAVCCRLDHYLSVIGDMIDTLPLGYRVNHPQLGHVTSPDPPRGTEKTKEFSVNWFAGCDNAEVTDGTVGRIKGVLPSRLCKMNLLKEFMEVSALYGRPLPEGADTYNQIKLTAEEFQEAKRFMKNLFRRGKAGTWVEKPVEVGMFPP